ncbi:MAG: DNA polymerase I, partial [Bacilli bacterium]|nr:DNA polymerase I [Bacilli bacterium]
KLLNTFKGDESIFVAFDKDSHTFRKEEFAEYKANRPPCPEELVTQFPISRELMDAMGIVYYEQHGVEADDIAGTVAKMAAKEGYEVNVYTSDKDYLQLIDENITVYLLKVGLSNMEAMTPATMQEKFGFAPLQIIDFKGLRGDSSDNLPGIPGIGDKTAVKLIQEYGSFEKIIEAGETMKGKIGENLRTYAEQGRVCYRLATIKTDVELPFTLEDLRYKGYQFSTANEFAQKYEMKQFLSRLPLSYKKNSETENEPFELEEVESFANIPLGNPIGLALDINFDDYHDAEVHGLAIDGGKKTYYIKAENLKSDAVLREILENEGVRKSVYDGKATIYALRKLGINLRGITNDLMLAAYLLDSSLKNLPEMIYSYFGVDILTTDEDLGLLSLNNPSKTSLMAHYAKTLIEKIEKMLEENEELSLYRNIEIPLMAILAEMELEGFPLHKEELLVYGKGFEEKKNALQEEIYSLVGHKFNINSPKQLAEILYDEMGLKGPKDRSTSVEVLKNLEDKSPLIAKILEYRKYAKLMGTYIDGLVPHIKNDGKIHSYFNQALTSTGRLSSSSPNLQNISARDEEAKQIRNAFYYDDKSLNLVSFDYGQVELRVMAALSNCKNYIEVFESDRDVHTETAKKIFHTEEVTPLMRRRAKAVNFAIIYGTTVYGLADQIEGSIAEAQEIIKNFYLTYPEVGEFLNSVIKEVETKGYVKTLFGRRRYLREIEDPNYAKREAARRAALNAPVQGTAADLIKVAMIKVDSFLKKNKLKTKLVLQIHDELIFAVPDEELDLIKEKIAEIMVHAVSLPVKLTVECGVGKSWYNAKE